MANSYLSGKKFSEGEISLRSLDSHRIRLGSQVTYQTDWKLFPWLGAYYERELAGTADGSAKGLKILQRTLWGDRAAGKRGLSYRPIPLASMDLTVCGSMEREKSIPISL
jgi:hypothetical protein